jgi:hypothetical protein
MTQRATSIIARGGATSADQLPHAAHGNNRDGNRTEMLTGDANISRVSSLFGIA